MYNFHIPLVAERHMAIYITVFGLFVLVQNRKTKRTRVHYLEYLQIRLLWQVYLDFSTVALMTSYFNVNPKPSPVHHRADCVPEVHVSLQSQGQDVGEVPPRTAATD